MTARSYGKSIFSLARNHQTVFQVAVPFCIPTGNDRESLLLQIPLACGVVSVLDFGHSHRYAVVSHCCLNLHFPDNIGYGPSFHTFICCLYIFFAEVSVKVFGPFINQVACFHKVFRLRIGYLTLGKALLISFPVCIMGERLRQRICLFSLK